MNTELILTKSKKNDRVQYSTTTKNIAQATIYEEKIFKENPHDTKFVKKDIAINYIQKNKNKKLYLISEDLCTQNGSKCYYALNYDLLYYLVKTKKFSLYECFEANEKIKLSLDLDVYIRDIPKNVDHQIYFDNLINRAINLIEKKLGEHKIDKPEIIILSSNREDKMSAHIIFNNVCFEDVYAIKIFMLSVNSDLINNNIIDLSIYKTGCLRLLWCSKLGKSNNLEFYKAINYEFKDEKQLFMDTLLKNINDKCQLIPIKIPDNIKITRRINKATKTVNINEINQNNLKTPLNLIKKYLDILNNKRYEKYGDWIQIGMIIFNNHPNKDGFELWNEWSSKSPNYDGRNICAYKWNTFNFNSLSVGTLKYYARLDNYDLYCQIEYSLEKQAFDSIKFKMEYLLDKDEKLLDKKSLVAQQVCNWIESKDVKTLAVKSTYDTGKTSLVKKILTEFDRNFKRVLFISYRQTLTNELYGNFNMLHVENYLDGSFFGDRLICQIESLDKILNASYQFEIETEIPGYDLIVLDELESIINHFESDTVKRKEETYETLLGFIHNSNKVLALDGDFSNRSFEFINEIKCYNVKEPKCTILENEIQKNKRHFIFTNNREDYDKEIDDDLKNGKNIIIVSMSSSIADYYYKLYSGKYKTVLHTSKVDDKFKKELKDVNNFWVKYQLVIYSPSIESGVNFDKEHFDKIYIVLSANSTSQRGLLQMTSRCRKLKNSNIMIYLNGLPYHKTGCFFKYDEVKEYSTDILSNYLPRHIITDDKTGKKVYRFRHSLYNNILIHNLVEKLNKESKLFVPYLLKLLEQKGHTYELKEKSCSKKTINKGSIMKEEILKADDIDNDTYEALLNKQKSNQATRDEKMTIEKHIIKKDWNINKIDYDFMEKFYGKTHVLYNLRWLIDETKIDPYLMLKDEKIVDFNKAEKLEQIKIIKELINKLGYKSVTDEKSIDKKTFEENWKKTMTECQLFTNPIKCKPLLCIKYKKKLETTKAYLGFINTILKDFGFMIKVKQKNDKKKIEGKWKTVSSEFYFIDYPNEINKYI